MCALLFFYLTSILIKDSYSLKNLSKKMHTQYLLNKNYKSFY